MEIENEDSMNSKGKTNYIDTKILDRKTLWGLFILLGTIFATISVQHYRNDIHPANESARIYAAWAIVDHHTVALDPVFDEILPSWRSSGRPPNRDVAVANNRYLLDKAPGVTFLAIPIVAVMRLVGARPDFATTAWILTLLLAAVPSAIFVVFAINRMGGRFQGFALAAGLIATPWLVYAGLLFGHALAASLVGLAAFMTLGSMDRTAGDPHYWRNAFLGGFFAGFAVLTEYPTAFMVVALAIALATDGTRRHRLIPMVLGGTIPALMLMAWNQTCFGGPFNLSYGFKAADDFAAICAQGAWGISAPSLDRLWALTFSPSRGIFFAAPWLLSAPVAIAALILRKEDATAWKVFLVTGGIGYAIFISGFVDFMGGSAMGPRHLLPVIPVFAIAIARAMPVNGTLASLMLGTVLSSYAFSAISALGWPYHPESIANPTFDLALPVMIEGGFAPTVWDAFIAQPTGSILAFIAGGAVLLAAFLYPRPSGPHESLTIRPITIAVAVVVALAHLSITASSTSGTGHTASESLQIIRERATAHELLGHDDIANKIRNSLKSWR